MLASIWSMPRNTPPLRSSSPPMLTNGPAVARKSAAPPSQACGIRHKKPSRHLHPSHLKILKAMANPLEMLQKFQALDLEKETAEAIRETERELTDKVRYQLFVKGEDATGKRLRPYRNKRYARYKHQRNPLPGEGNPDFFLTGETHRALFAKPQGDKILYGSTSENAPLLEQRDGPGVFAPSPESIQDYSAETLHPLVIRRIKYLTGTR